MKSTLLGIIVLNIAVILVGILLMLRNIVSSQAFNIGLALTFLALSIILLSREVDTG